MDKPLRVLIVEDSQRDAALEVRALEAAGYRVTHSIVDTAAGMKAALAGGGFDIVLSDHDMPQFDAPGALALLKQSGPDIPFIVVSGNIGEELTAALIRDGASDFVTKARLSRLAPAVEHALKDAENRRGLKRAEEKLKQSEDRYRTLVEQAFEGIIVIREGKIVFANPRAFEMIDFPRDRTEPRPFMDFIHPPDREKVVDRHLRRLTGEKFEETYPIRLVDQKGNLKWIMLSAALIDWDGKPATLTFLTDISKQREAAEQLRESERVKSELLEKLNEAQHLAMIGSWEWDLQTDRVWWSDETYRIFGVSAQDFVPSFEAKGKFIHPDDFESYGKSFQYSLQTGELLDFNPRIITPDGQLKYCHAEGKIIYDKSGKRICFIGTLMDITRRRLAEEKLEQSYESLKKTLDDAINTMVKIVEIRDPYTAGHQQKVADLATAIAREMKWEDTRIDHLRRASVIHDIGKIYVPSDILSKPGKLSEIEFSLIKTHSQSSYDIVKGMDFPGVVAEAILQHHERLDGSGYPKGLKGEDTLPEAKILVIADVVEAMAANRPYRPALGIDRALEELSRNRGKLYEPEAVDVCLALFRSGKFEFKPV
jgi:PAS domain S-box-containing protein